MKVIFHKIVTTFPTSHARPATKRSYSSLPTQFDMIDVLSSWPWATYTKAILCVSRLEKRKNHTTVRLNNCFPSRSTSYSFLTATSSFIFPVLFISCEYSPRFPPLTCFPALIKDHKFSRGFYRLHIFPRLQRVACFPALSISPAFCFEFWLTNTAAWRPVQSWLANTAAWRLAQILSLVISLV